MITVLSMNPSVDKSVQIERFVYGGMNRVLESRFDAGGKGVNVAVVASSLGERAACVGLLGSQDGEIIEGKLAAFGVETAFVRTAGRVRTNLKLFDRRERVVTEVNEPGEPADETLLAQVEAIIGEYAKKSAFLVLTGSTPPGCPKDYYAGVIGRLQGLPCKCVLDAEGEALHAGIAAKPYLIKPNRMELEKEVGRALPTMDAVLRAARDIARGGVKLCCVSLGGEGALLTDGREAVIARAARVAVRSTVGAGDSMVAGMMSAIGEGLPLAEILRRGAACATASVMAEGTQLATRADCERVAAQIEIERME